MSPSYTPNDVQNGSMAHAKFPSHFAEFTVLSGVAQSNLSNLIGSKFRRVMGLPPRYPLGVFRAIENRSFGVFSHCIAVTTCHASLYLRISHIVPTRAQKEMRGIAARRVIAFMANQKRPGLNSGSEKICHSMRPNRYSLITSNAIHPSAIARLMSAANPRPTFIWTIMLDFILESVKLLFVKNRKIIMWGSHFDLLCWLNLVRPARMFTHSFGPSSFYHKTYAA